MIKAGLRAWFCAIGPAFHLGMVRCGTRKPAYELRPSPQLSPPITEGITLDNSTAVEDSADRQTAARARQVRLSATACGSGNALNESAIVGSIMRARLRKARPIGRVGAPLSG